MEEVHVIVGQTAYTVIGETMDGEKFKRVVLIDNEEKDVINYLQEKYQWKIEVCRLALPAEMQLLNEDFKG